MVENNIEEDDWQVYRVFIADNACESVNIDTAAAIFISKENAINYAIDNRDDLGTAPLIDAFCLYDDDDRHRVWLEKFCKTNQISWNI